VFHRLFECRYLVYPLILGFFVASCDVDPVQPGEVCPDDGEQTCRTATVALYCSQGHWFERDCWVECRYMGFEVGSCGLNSQTGDETCFCAPDEVWAYYDEGGIGAACEHEGNQLCYGSQELRVCIDGHVRKVDCADACAGSVSSFCGFDPERGDDSCICCDGPTCP